MTNNRKTSRLEFDPLGDTSKGIQYVVPVEIYLLAGLVEGDGKESNRLVIRPKGAPVEAFRFLMPRGAEAHMEVPAGWVFDAIAKKLGDAAAPIPEERVEVPIGDPLGGGK